MLRRLALATVATAAILAPPAHAITYGEVDGNRHPFVGALVGQYDDGLYPYCSGTLISSTVFLTAAHCDDGVERVRITFDSKWTQGGTTLAGSFHANPAYNGTQDDPQDIAVVVLDRAVRGVTPAKLPQAGLLDRMKRDGTLTQSTRFTSVGYGADEVTNGPGGQQLTYNDTRQFAVGSFNALGKGYLRLSQNPAVGDGGTCYGDSGGPNFLGAGASETTTVAGTTITGDWWCKSTNTTQRLDTKASRAFLGQYVKLP